MPKSKEVDAWFKRYDSPMKATVLRVRDIILGADRRMSECIKWSAPTFTFEGNLASFNPRSKVHASLMFHTGAKIPGKFKYLLGSSGTVRIMQFRDVADANKQKADLTKIVRAWIELRSGGAKKPPRKKAATKKKATKKKAAKKRAPARKKALRKAK